ncbi:MAG: hypothetical protein ACHQU0_02820 [Candidatus Paceibacteria bacterium]
MDGKCWIYEGTVFVLEDKELVRLAAADGFNENLLESLHSSKRHDYSGLIPFLK